MTEAEKCAICGGPLQPPDARERTAAIVAQLSGEDAPPRGCSKACRRQLLAALIDWDDRLWRNVS